MSRRSARNRHPRAVAKAAPRIPRGGVTFSPEQLAAVLGAAQQRLASGSTQAVPMPRPPEWSDAPFGPSRGLYPAPINVPRPDTGRAEPRIWEYPVSYNLQVDSRHHVPWKTLQDAADMPLFRKCIERRKSICQLGYAVGVDPKAVAREAALAGQSKNDVESALRKKYTSEIARVSDWLAEPDRKNGYDWSKWTSLLMENRLVYDATVVYPRRTYGGALFAFEVIDGKTIKPLLDEYGGRPMPPYPAYQQILYGFPRGEFTADTTEGPDGKTTVPGLAADEMLYERTILRPHSPYGMSATEIALLDGLVWMRRMGWMLAEYTEGVMPAAHIEVDAMTTWDVTQWEDWQRALNDHLGGNTNERLKFPLFPPGTKPVQAATIPEQYRPDYDLFLVKLIAGDYGLPASEVGFTEAGALGASFHEGEEDILNRQTRRPDAEWLSGIATRLSVRQLGMPPVLSVQILGLESEDEAAADAVAQNQTGSARMTLNEDRARRGLPPYDFPEADMPMLISDRGIVFVEGASQAAPPGTLIQPATIKPGGPGDSAGPAPAAPGAPQQPPAGPRKPPAGADAAQAGVKSAAALGWQAHQAATLARSMTQALEDITPASAASDEVSAYRNWVRKQRSRPQGGAQFRCNVVTSASVAALAPDMAADDRVVFKDGSPGGPGKAESQAAGLAGAGTLSS